MQFSATPPARQRFSAAREPARERRQLQHRALDSLLRGDRDLHRQRVEVQLVAGTDDAPVTREAPELPRPRVQVAVEAIAFVEPDGRGGLTAGQQLPRLDSRGPPVRGEAHELAGLQRPEADEATGGVVHVAQRVRPRPNPHAHERLVAPRAVDRDALLVAVAVDDEHGRLVEVGGLEGDRRVGEVMADEAHLGHVAQRAVKAEVALQPGGGVLQAPLHAVERRGERNVPPDRHDLDVVVRRAGLLEAVCDREERATALGVLGAAEALLLTEGEQGAVAADEARRGVVPPGGRCIDPEDHGRECRMFRARALRRRVSRGSESAPGAASSRCRRRRSR